MSSSREDPSLAEHIQRGQRLIETAAAIESQDDFLVWRSDRNRWIWMTAEALERWHGPETANALRHAPGQPAPSSHWRRVLPLEISRVHHALEILSELDSHT
jgi:hypothetical protein